MCIVIEISCFSETIWYTTGTFCWSSSRNGKYISTSVRDIGMSLCCTHMEDWIPCLIAFNISSSFNIDTSCSCDYTDHTIPHNFLESSIILACVSIYVTVLMILSIYETRTITHIFILTDLSKSSIMQLKSYFQWQFMFLTYVSSSSASHKISVVITCTLNTRLLLFVYSLSPPCNLQVPILFLHFFSYSLFRAFVPYLLNTKKLRLRSRIYSLSYDKVSPFK